MADGKVIIDTALDSTGFEKGLNKLGSVAKTGSKIAIGALGGVTAALSGFAAYSIKVGSDFEAAMSQVAAISGATGEELEKLEAKAKEMGATTMFSASESAAAMNYMAMAGWNAQQMMDGLEGVMNLAAASGEDLATTSDIVTDAITAFGMKAEDANHFADVLATTASNANTTVYGMGETFKYAGAMAGSLGYSIEDVALATGLMANAGIKGTMAGTSINSIMTRLATNTSGAADALAELGVSFYDADGNARDFSDVIDEVRIATAGMTAEQKSQFANTVAGVEAQKGLLAILNASEEDYNKLATAINSADGSAQKMAETMQDNLQGKFTIMKSAMEGFGIEVYNSLEEPLKSAVEKGTEYINRLTEALQSGGLEGAAKEAGSVFADIVTDIAEAAPGMIDAAASFIRSFVEGIIANKDKLIEAAGQICKALVNGLVALLPKEIAQPIKKTFDAIGQSMKNGGMKQGIKALVDAFKTLIKVIGRIIDVVGPAIVKIFDAIGRNAKIIIPILTGIVTAFVAFKVISVVISLVTSLKAALSALISVAMTFPVTALVVAATSVIAAFAMWESTFSPLAQSQQKLEDSTKSLASAYEEFGEDVKKHAQTLQSAESEYGKYSDTLFATQESLDKLQEGLSETQNGITAIFEANAGERMRLTDEELEKLEMFYTRQDELYQQQIEIEQKKQEAIQAQIEAEINSFEGSTLEYEQNQARYLATLSESHDKELELLREQEVTKIAQKQQELDLIDGLSQAERDAEINAITSYYAEQRKITDDAYTERVNIVTSKHDELAGNYEGFVPRYEAVTKQMAELETDYNAKIKSLEEERLDELISSGMTYDQAYRKVQDERKEADRVYNNQMAELQSELTEIMQSANDSQVDNLVATSAYIKAEGGKLSDTQKAVLGALIANWKVLPEDSDAKTAIATMFTQASEGYADSYPAFEMAIAKGPDAVIELWQKIIDDDTPLEATKDATEKAAEGIEEGTPTITQSIRNLAGTIQSVAKGEKLPDKLRAEGADTSSGLATGLSSGKSDVASATAELLDSVSESAASVDLKHKGLEIAWDFTDGLVIGLGNGMTQVFNQAKALSEAAVQGSKKGADSHSPSKKTIQLGHDMGDGLIIGMEDRKKAVTSSSQNLTLAALDETQKLSILSRAKAAMTGTLYSAAASMALGAGNTTTYGGSTSYGDINQVVNINQPVKSPVETARELKKTARDIRWA